MLQTVLLESFAGTHHSTVTFYLLLSWFSPEERNEWRSMYQGKKWYIVCTTGAWLWDLGVVALGIIRSV